jgi:hypothetical protein
LFGNVIEETQGFIPAVDKTVEATLDDTSRSTNDRGNGGSYNANAQDATGATAGHTAFTYAEAKTGHCTQEGCTQTVKQAGARNVFDFHDV